MSLANQLESEINAYTDQLSAYKEQVNEYKNQLLAAKTNSSDFTKSLVTEVGIPVGTELIRVGATKLFGAPAGELVGKLAGTGLKQAAGANQGSLAENLANTARQATTGAAPAEESAVSDAGSLVSSALNRIRSAGTDALSSAEEGLAGAQEGLTSAASSAAENIASRVSGSVSDLIQSQVSRLSGVAEENGIAGILRSAKSAIQAPEDTSVFGDVELSNMASAVPRAGIPDLSLPFESAFEAPLSKFSLDAVPDAFSGISDLATGTLAQAGQFAARMTEPLAQSGLSSNMIARAFMNGRPADASIEIPDSVIPTQEEALSMLSQQVRPMITSDLLPQGAGSIEGTIGSAVEGLTSGAEGLAATASSAVEGLASPAISSITSALSGAGEAAAGAAGAAGEAVGAAVGEAAGEAAVGALAAGGEAAAATAETGPGALIVGAAVAIGTFIYDMFHHHEQTPIAPPPLAPMSVPSFQPGLATGN